MKVLRNPRKLIVIGGGEHACVVIDAAKSRPDLFTVLGVVDADPVPKAVRQLKIPRLGGDQSALARASDRDTVFILGFAGLHSRPSALRLTKLYEARGARFAVVVHASAVVSPTARLQPGVFVAARAVIQTGARLSRHAVVNTGSIVEHDVVLGAFAHLAPGSITGGGARIGARAFVGLGASIRDHVEVGSDAVVGMGATVVGDVPKGARVIGTPARRTLKA